MLLFRIALRNLSRRGRKTLVVAVLIAVGVATFFVGNAVLESSIGGIQSTFAGNFTADLSVSARSDQSFSLFGPDIPIIGEYESEPVIVNAADVGARVSKMPGVAAVSYVLSSPLLLEAGGSRGPGLGLGAIGDEYFALFRAPRFVLGAPPRPGSSGWAVITEEWANEISSALGHPVAPGEKLQLSLFRNQTFTIREATLVGVIRYQPGNIALRHVVITDGRILRALIGYSQTDAPSGGSAGGQAVVGAGGGDTDIDSLFSAVPGKPAGTGRAKESSSPISTDELKNLLNEAHREGASAVEAPLGHDGAWHFILLRTQPGANKSRIANDLRRTLAGADLAVQVRDWRGTAGGVASYVFLMQIVLYVGIFMLGGIVLILTMNSIVMSVFERTAEIGTMRAIGAPRRFVQGLFILETCALTVVSGIAGVLLGFAIVAFLNHVPLELKNQMLILLFGENSLHPVVTVRNVVVSAGSSLVLGLIAWAYPVRLALRIQPVRAIHAS
ncbi:MAG: FtsX-like permease family protein [Spirochaetia bacterium]